MRHAFPVIIAFFFCCMWKQCQHMSVCSVACDIILALCMLLESYLTQIV